MSSSSIFSSPGSQGLEANDRKKRLGQYFTGIRLASLLARISSAENVDSALDPMVGNGDMLAAVTKLAPAAKLYGIELDAKHANDARQRLGKRAQIVAGNAFEWKTIKKLPCQRFDLVITNPPYVRYQTLSANGGDELPNAEMVRSGLLDIISSVHDIGENDRKIFLSLAKSYSGLSDLAIPSWILAAMLVRPGGTLAMVVPETWLTRDYADCIKYLLLKLFRIRWVIENEARDWFDDAQIKTTLVVADKRKQSQALSLSHSDEFVRVSLEKAAQDDHSPVGGLFPDRTDPDAAFLEMIMSAKKGRTQPIKGASILKQELTAELDELLAVAQTSPWLLDLEPWIAAMPISAEKRLFRLPHPLLNLLPEDIALNMQSLSLIGVRVGQGLRTGANTFFYCDLMEIGEEFSWVASSKLIRDPIRIPNNVLLPVLRKQAEMTESFALDVSCLSGRVLILDSFSPPEANELKQGRILMPEGLKRLVLAAQQTKSGSTRNQKLIPELSAVRTNVSEPNAKNDWVGRHWFMLPPLTRRHQPDLMVARVNHLHPRTILNPEGRTVIDANFSTIWIEHGDKWPKPLSILALMNSSWCVAAMELLGAVMGGGALKLEATHLSKLPIPNLNDENWRYLEKLGEDLVANWSQEHTLNKIDRLIASVLFEPENENNLLAELLQIKEKRLYARGTK